jgi:hypothetical protein
MKELGVLAASIWGGGEVEWNPREISVGDDAVIVVVVGEIVGGSRDGAVIIQGVLPDGDFNKVGKTKSPYLGGTPEGRSLLLSAALAREEGKPTPILLIRKRPKLKVQSFSPSAATKGDFLLATPSAIWLPTPESVASMLYWLNIGRHWQTRLFQPQSKARVKVRRARDYCCDGGAVCLAECRMRISQLHSKSLGVLTITYLQHGADSRKRIYVVSASVSGTAEVTNSGLLGSLAEKLVAEFGARGKVKTPWYRRQTSRRESRQSIMLALAEGRSTAYVYERYGCESTVHTLHIVTALPLSGTFMIVTSVNSDHNHTASPTAALTGTAPLRSLTQAERDKIGTELLNGTSSIADMALSLFATRNLHSE